MPSLPPVYTKLTIKSFVGPGSFVIPSSPGTGLVWVIVDLTLWTEHNSIFGSVGGITITDSEDKPIVVQYSPNCRSFYAYHHTGRWVLEEGDTLQGIAQETWAVRGTVYELTVA